MIFKIDFTRPHLYEDVVTLNQGNLSTNNTLRCTVVTGGNDDVTGASIPCTFVVGGKQIYSFGKVVEGSRGIVDIVFPSEALVVGENTLEFLVNRVDGSVAQSPIIKYKVWQGLTTDAGVMADSNYPLLVQLINEVNEANIVANKALEGANSVISQGDELKASVEASIASNTTRVDIAIAKNDASVVKAENATQQAINSATNCDVKTAENIKNVNVAIASGTQDLEVKYARTDMDGKEHTSLKDRLESDLKKGKLIEETKEGTYLSFNDTVGGIVSDIEVLGNTVQDVSNLANIRSSCIPNGDGTFKMSILSCGENLFNKNVFTKGKYISYIDGSIYDNETLGYSDYIRIDSSKAIFSTNWRSVAYYDSSKNFISGEDNVSVDSKKLSIPISAKYLRITYRLTSLDVSMLNYGTSTTPYAPYQETRCDIKLPCQLEKWDRLYFDREEDAWCVDKNMAYTLFNGSENWVPWNLAETTPNPNLAYFVLDGGRVNPNLLSSDGYSNQFEVVPPTDVTRECMSYRKIGDIDRIYLAINKSKANNISELKTYLKNNNLLVKYLAKIPQKIVLPQNEQIKLNSFANKTHIYTISGDVDATVKATVSKSLASTVQANTNEINILNDKIADIQGLKESQDFAYELPNGQNYLVCKDTQNGTVKDLKIYGKSVVNVAPKSIAPIKLSIDKRVNDTTLISPILANTEFTVGVNVTAKKAPLKGLLISFRFADGTFAYDVLTTGVYSQFKTFKFSKDVMAISEYLHLDELTADATANITFDSLIVCEGVINTYFEGIASVGNGNEVEVSTRKEDGNLLNTIKDGEKTGISNFNIINDYSFNYTSNAWGQGIRVKIDNIIKGETYVVLVDGSTSGSIDGSGALTTGDKLLSTYGNRIEIVASASGDGYVRFKNGVQSGNISFENIRIVKKGSNENFSIYKQDKKTILFKDTDNTWKPVTNLRGIDENSCDLIEKDKFTQKIGFKNITNNDNLETVIGTDLCYRVALTISDMKPKDTPLLCDKYVNASVFDVDTVGIKVGGSDNKIYIQDLKSKYTDINDFKSKININVLYVLNNSKAYEINPIYPDSYENETMILIDSGVVAPKASFKITSSLTGFIQNVEDRVSRLENNVYKTNLANFAVALNMLDMETRLRSLEAPIN